MAATMFEKRTALRCLDVSPLGVALYVTIVGSQFCIAALLPCAKTGMSLPQQGRMWDIAPLETVESTIKTALLAVRQFVEHEVLESFTYQGVRVFDPHAPLIKENHNHA